MSRERPVQYFAAGYLRWSEYNLVGYSIYRSKLNCYIDKHGNIYVAYPEDKIDIPPLQFNLG